MHTFYVPIPVIVQTNMSIFLISLILVWSQMSGVYVVALFVDGKNENKSTVNNGSCRSCFCEPVASNCKEFSTRRIRPSLNRMLSDDGLPNTYSDDRSCVVPLNVSEYNNTNDPPPSYHDVQNTRTDFSSLRYSTRSPVQSADLNHDGSYNNYNASLFLTSPVDDEPPPSYDDFMAIYHSKLTKVHDDFPPNYANDRLYTAMPVDTMESARDLRTTFIVSETDILCAQV